MSDASIDAIELARSYIISKAAILRWLAAQDKKDTEDAEKIPTDTGK